jgi:putative ABC transport system permease protein
MLRNYLKTAWRSVRRRPYLSALNVFGLALGLAAALLIALYVGHERGFDRFHERSGRLYRVLLEREESQVSDSGPAALADQLTAAFPSVEAAVAVSQDAGEKLVEAGGERFYEEDLGRAGPSFFDLFSFEAVHGDLAGPLAEPGSVVLTRQKARKYFGEDNPVGRTLTVFDEGHLDLDLFRRESSISFDTRDVTYTVTAVVEAPPSTSTVQIGVLRSFPSDQLQQWNILDAHVYALLDEGTPPEAVRSGLPSFTEQHAGSFADDFSLRIQPLVDAHLYPQMGRADGLGPVAYLWLFAAAALMILLIACVNYANLATARAAERAKEVGVRKTAGATRGALAAQFLGEALLVTSAALALALLSARVLLPVFEGVVGADLALGHLPGGLWTLAGGTLGVALLSGAYPALVLSGLRPVQVLSGSAPGLGGRSSWLRKGLVVFQFAASVALVLATVVIQQQMQFVRAERLDTGEDEVVVVPLRGDALSGGAYDTFKRRLESRPGVRGVTTGQPPGEGARFRMGNDIDTTSAFDYLYMMIVGDDFTETFGLEVVAGHAFENAPVGNLDSTDASLINETAAAMVGGEAIIGQPDSPFNSSTVVGIVEDFHLRSLHEDIAPLAILYSSGVQSSALVRLEAGRTAEGLDAVRATWGALVPERPLSFYFLDDKLDEQYRSERRLARVFGAFGLVAVLVAGLGLFGLAAHAAQARTKEIGIRKALGASAGSIVTLLSTDFLKLVALGFALAAPLTWLAMQRWLQDFAYRTEVGAGLFLLVGAAAAAVALLAVGTQALRAARTNPAQALRDE